VRALSIFIGSIAIFSLFALNGLNITDDVELDISPLSGEKIDYSIVKEWNHNSKLLAHRYVLTRPQKFSVVTKNVGGSRISEMIARQENRETRKQCDVNVVDCELNVNDIWRSFEDPIYIEILSTENGVASKSEKTISFKKNTRTTIGFFDAVQ